MSLFVCSLNSGSNGNCYYVGSGHEAVLIDAGISCRETQKRMKRAGLNIANVKAIFISHEHSDHINGTEMLASRYQIPVYITPATLQNSGMKLEPSLIRSFTAGESVTIGALQVQCFKKFHDAVDPHSFTVSRNGVTVGVLTDIGAPCENVIAHFRQCNAVFLEANYDDVMLQNGRYPPNLKKRITSDVGHLSNAQALQLFTVHKAAFLSHLFLSHLSRDNNNPEVARKLFAAHAGNTNVIVASRDAETNVYQIVRSNCEIFPQVSQTSLF